MRKLNLTFPKCLLSSVHCTTRASHTYHFFNVLVLIMVLRGPSLPLLSFIRFKIAYISLFIVL